MAGALRPDRVALGLVALLGALALWNAATYPGGSGYDATSHREYAEFVVAHHRLPVRNETPEYYSPPAYYAVAGTVGWVAHRLGVSDPYKAGQLLNVPIAVAFALCVLALARTLWPARPWLAVAALAFLVACPELPKVLAMYHPEPLDALLATLALLLAARLLVRRDYSLRSAALLGVVLGLGELVRQFALWTLAVVVLALLAAAVRDRRALRVCVVAFATTAVLAAPWYVYRLVHYDNPIFDRPQVQEPLWGRRPASFYVGTGLPDVFTRPYRPHFVNRAVPQTYADLWGDWYGVWSRTRAWLSVQSAAGVVPTALAVVGWLALLVTSVRRLDAPRLLVALLPLAGIAGYLYFTVSYPTPDGDVLKPLYMLTTAGAWALCFGWLVDRLGTRRPRLVLPLALLGAVSLAFAPYKGTLGWF